MKIGIVGNGTVGHATARCFMEHAEVRVYDVVPERATHSLGDVLACDLIFVCLPTPQKADSLECDTSAIDMFFRDRTLHGIRPHADANYVIRSTVPIGYTRSAREKYDLPNLCHSPEFLTARCAVTDAQIPARNIVGVPEPHAGEPKLYTGNNRAAQELNILYCTRFPGVQMLLMSSDESEATKLFLNGFFAVKVAYWNEVYTLAEHFRLDWDRVMRGVLSDGRVAHSHTKVPGPDGKFGYGPDMPNACLPKDSASLIHQLESNGLLASVTRGAMERNRVDRQRKA